MLAVANESFKGRRPGSFIDEQKYNSSKQTKERTIRRPLHHARSPSVLVLCVFSIVIFDLLMLW